MSQFKADLIVALASTTVRDGHAAFTSGDFHHALGNDRPGKVPNKYLPSQIAPALSVGNI